MMKLFVRAIVVFFVFTFFQNQLHATAYGSDSAVSIENPTNISGPDNIINSFAYLNNGFTYADASTTCSYKSVFPLMGDINLSGGKLYLQSDLIMNNNSNFLDFGYIKAQGHRINFPENFKSFSTLNESENTRKVLELKARVTALANINSLDWSYDGNYVAVGTNNAVQDLQIYAFDGSSLTLAASYNFGTTNVYSVRWNPNNYFLAAVTSRASYKINLLQFTPPNTLSLLNSQNPAGDFNAVAWNAYGTHIAAAGNATAGITTYRFNTGTNIFDTQITPTNTAALNGTIQKNCLKWAPRRSRQDLIAGTDGGSLHLYNFTGAALNHLKRYDLGSSVNTFDWAKTSTYIAVGFANSTIKTYQHTADVETIGYKNSYTTVSAVNSVSWTDDATELSAGYALSLTGNEAEWFNFNSSTYALTSKCSRDVAVGVNVVMWGVRGSAPYLLRGDSTTNYISVYKPVFSPFQIQDAKIFLNSDLTLEVPLTFTGNCIIDGGSHSINFIGDGAIHLAENSSLDVQLANLKFNEPAGVVLQSSTSKISFKDTKMQLNSDIVWGDGSFNVYADLTITGNHTFNYQSLFTSTINAFSKLNLEGGATFKLGKTRNTTIEPLMFVDNTAELNLSNATLHVTNSGMNIKKGSINSYGNSNLVMDWIQGSSLDTKVTATNQGLVLGDGQNISNDSILTINSGTLNVSGGGIVLDPAVTSTMLQFYGMSKLSVDQTTTVYIKQPIIVNNGWIGTDPTSQILVNSDAYFSLGNTRMSDAYSAFDFNLTGTFDDLSTISLDQNDSIIIDNGSLQRTLNIHRDGNLITGNGRFYGDINFEDSRSTLSWNLTSFISAPDDIYLNGGRFILLQNTALDGDISLKNTGTVDLQSHTLNLGAEQVTWEDDLYWMGDGGIICLNKDITLDGCWTISGNVQIDGKNNLIDFGTTGSIILERGASLTFRNITLYRVSRQTPITCMDDSCEVGFDFSNLILSGDYLFDKGSMIVYNDSSIGIVDGLDEVFTFTYSSTKTSTITALCNLSIKQGACLSIGRQDSTIDDPERQPLVFLNPITSSLVLDGGTLNITSSGMIMTKGILNVSSSSVIQTENRNYPYGIIFGDGSLANDFEIKINAGTRLSLNSGRMFYNNVEDDRIVFDSQESVLNIVPQKGLYALKDLLLNNGSISTPDPAIVFPGFNPDAGLFAKNLHRYDYSHSIDYYVTGTLVAEPSRTFVLDSNDKLLINPGDLSVNILVKKERNYLTGIGNISGQIALTDWHSSLTWDLPVQYSAGDISLNGGRIAYTKNSGIGPEYSLKGTGTIDLTTTMFDLGTVDNTWEGDLYWKGDGGIINLNSDITLDGCWTISGNVQIDGNDNLIDFGTTGSIILEHGAHVIFKNISLYHLSRQTPITCMDDNCEVGFDFSNLILSGDYLFDKGSMIVYNDSSIGIVDGLDEVFTFTYSSTKTSTITALCNLSIKQGACLSIGRQDSTIDDPERQPLVFLNPITSSLVWMEERLILLRLA